MSPQDVGEVLWNAGFGKNHPIDTFIDTIRVTFAESQAPDCYIATYTGYKRVGSGGFKCCDAHTTFTNVNGTVDRGLMQVNSSWTSLSDLDAMDPVKCANYAYTNIFLPRETKAKGTGLTAWSSYTKQIDQVEARYLQYFIEGMVGAVDSWAKRKGRPYVGGGGPGGA